jgi:hypothetical protein
MALEWIPVIWKRRRVGKAKRAHQGRSAVGTAREERAFAHPTSDSSRSKSALADVQAILARLFTDASFRASFFADPFAVGRSLGLEPTEASALAELSRNAVEQFAATIRRKRADDVRKALPLTARALGGAFDRHVLAAIVGAVRPGRHRDDARALLDHLGRLSRSNELEPPWTADLARYEATFADVLHRSACLLVRRFRFPVARLAAAIHCGAPIGNIEPRMTIGVWLRVPGWRGITHRVW